MTYRTAANVLMCLFLSAAFSACACKPKIVEKPVPVPGPTRVEYVQIPAELTQTIPPAEISPALPTVTPSSSGPATEQP